MKIIHVTNSLTRTGGGTSFVVWGLALAQAATGDDIAIYALSDPYDIEDWPNNLPDNIKVRTFDRTGPAILGWSKKLHSALLDSSGGGSADILHQHGIWSMLSHSVNRWRDKWNKPTIISPHGMLDKWALSYKKCRKDIFASLIEKKNLTLASALHALSESESESIRQFGLNNPVAVIANGINGEEITNAALQAEPEKHFPELTGKKYALFLSRIHPKKGLINLLKAWNSTLEANFSLIRKDEWRLVIAGPDQVNHEAEIKSLANQLGIASSVIFTGPLSGEKKYAAFSGADFFVLPSFSEGFSIALLEAAALSRPLVFTSACNFQEMIDEGGGILVQPTPEDIKDGLTKIMSLSDDERKSMGHRAKQLIERSYTWTEIAKQMKSVYEEAIKLYAH